MIVVADLPRLLILAERSPLFGQLLPIADEASDNSVWFYFLGRVNKEIANIEEKRDLPVPVGC